MRAVRHIYQSIEWSHEVLQTLCDLCSSTNQSVFGRESFSFDVRLIKLQVMRSGAAEKKNSISNGQWMFEHLKEKKLKLTIYYLLLLSSELTLYPTPDTLRKSGIFFIIFIHPMTCLLNTRNKAVEEKNRYLLQSCIRIHAQLAGLLL